MKIPDEVIDLIENPETVKMLGTVDQNQDINLEKVDVLQILDNGSIAIGCFNQENKAIENIQKNIHASLAVFQPPILGYKLNGILKNIEKTGKTADHFKKNYTKNTVASIVIRITEIYALTLAISGEKII